MKYFTLVLCLALFASCKTRKVVTDTTQTSTKSNIEQQSQVHKVDSASTVDNSVRTNETHAETKSQAEDTTEFHADSAVTTTGSDGTTKTKFYINGNVKTISNRSSTKDITKKDTTRNNIVRTNKTVVDSSSKSKIKTDTKTKSKHKATEAVGSGTTIAKYIGIGLIILMVGLVIFGFVKYGKNT